MTRRRHHLAVLLLIVSLLALLIWPRDRLPPRPNAVPPLWQVSPSTDGRSSEVLGLTLGRSTLADAQARFGGDLALGLIEAADGRLALEAFAARVESGFVSGAVVVAARVDPARLAEWRQRATKSSPQPSGARRWTLAAADRTAAGEQIVSGLSFLPAIRLDAAMLDERFGPPGRRWIDAEVTHYQYPALGLDVAIGESGKAVLQYVPPAAWDRLDGPQAPPAS